MADHRDQKVATPGMADLDDAELLGFDCLGPDEGARTEQAIGTAFKKSGLSGEGPVIK